MAGSGQTAQKNKLSLEGLPDEKCSNEQKRRSPTHKKAPGAGAAWLGGTRTERGRGRERKNSGAWRVAPKNQALPSGALPAESAETSTEGVAPRAEGAETSTEGAALFTKSLGGWALSGSAQGARAWGQEEESPIPLPKKGLPGKRQKKKPPGGSLGGQPISPERMAWASSLAK